MTARRMSRRAPRQRTRHWMITAACVCEGALRARKPPSPSRRRVPAASFSSHSVSSPPRSPSAPAASPSTAVVSGLGSPGLSPSLSPALLLTFPPPPPSPPPPLAAVLLPATARASMSMPPVPVDSCSTSAGPRASTSALPCSSLAESSNSSSELSESGMSESEPDEDIAALGYLDAGCFTTLHRSACPCLPGLSATACRTACRNTAQSFALMGQGRGEARAELGLRNHNSFSVNNAHTHSRRAFRSVPAAPPPPLRCQ